MNSANLVSFALAVVICAIGIAALLGHALRPKPKDRLLLWIGAFAVCYGVRLIISIDPVARLFISEWAGYYAESTINYVILIPATLFAEELYGLGWRRSLRWLVIATAAYASAAIVINVATRDPGRMPDPALILLVPGLVLVFLIGALKGYRPKPFPEWRILIGAFIVFFAFVFHEHAVNAGLVPWRIRIEPLGMLIFNLSLAYIAVRRFFSGQRQLIEIEKEMQAARQIQSSILPRDLPSLAGIELAVRYVPLAAVAGDFYDVVTLDDGGTAVLVADVSGHGVPAALVASMVKVAFVAEASRSGDPAAILGGMNLTLCGMFEQAYVTAVCVTIDSAAKTIRYAIAGHPPPVLVTLEGAVTTLDERGMFIGMFTGAAYRTASVPVDGGARLILYTDGLTEASRPNSDDLFGVERLEAFARDRRAVPVGQFTDDLLAAAITFAGHQPAQDDVTLMVVDVRPQV